MILCNTSSEISDSIDRSDSSDSSDRSDSSDGSDSSDSSESSDSSDSYDHKTIFTKTPMSQYFFSCILSFFLTIFILFTNNLFLAGLSSSRSLVVGLSVCLSMCLSKTFVKINFY